MFANGPGGQGFNPWSSHTKDSKKWFLMPPCLALSTIRKGSRVKRSNPGNGVAPFLTPWCSSYWKGSLRVTLDKRSPTLLTYMRPIDIQSRALNLKRFFLIEISEPGSNLGRGWLRFTLRKAWISFLLPTPAMAKPLGRLGSLTLIRKPV